VKKANAILACVKKSCFCRGREGGLLFGEIKFQTEEVQGGTTGVIKGMNSLFLVKSRRNLR